MYHLLDQAISILNNLLDILNSQPFLLLAITASFLIKTYIITQLLLHRAKHQAMFKRAWTLLILILLGSIIEDTAWILKLVRLIIFPSIDCRLGIFLLRIAWASTIIQYQALSLLVEHLITAQRQKISILNWTFLIASSYFCSIFIWLALFKTIHLSRPNIEYATLTQTSIYVPLIVMSILIATLVRLYHRNTPKILKRQLYIFIWGLIIPRVISDLIQFNPFNIIPSDSSSNVVITALSSILIAYAAYFCIDRLLRLRFLNLRQSVASKQSKNPFMERFKTFLEQLGTVLNLHELSPIVKSYFRVTLNIAEGRAKLYFRTDNPADLKSQIVETFLNNNQAGHHYLLKHRTILLLDELEFNQFYQKDALNHDLLTFLKQIDSEIFIPIYQEDLIIAYILIEQDPRSKRIYSNIEQDEITIFTQYLGSIINLMQKRNLNDLIEQEKQLKEELYQKHQQINQYKESIRSFIKQSQTKKVGILFYKSRRFIIGNQDANEIINFNLNTFPGHPLAQKLNFIAKQVEAYKNSQSCFAKDPQNQTIIITGIPSLEGHNVIITIHYPDITDVVKRQLDLLTDPSQWDYLLYLETTKSGQLINQLIPGSSESILNFKIELLKASLSKKAILISISDEDLIPTVELIHQISLRQNLYSLNLHAPSSDFETATQLFGINPIFGQVASPPLLQTLNQTGTLFINNIHHLNLETQTYLAEFIKYGFYRVFRSEQKIFSDVRIICATDQNLTQLVQESRFSKELYQELQKTSLVMPSLTSLPNENMQQLIEEIANTTVGNGSFKDLLTLNEREKQALISKHLESFQELKTQIKAMITDKSRVNHIQLDAQLNSSTPLHDSELADILKLGKYALKDRAAMQWLWNKFQNQNKIASLLNVNRSSVQRRCKEFGFY